MIEKKVSDVVFPLRFKKDPQGKVIKDKEGRSVVLQIGEVDDAEPNTEFLQTKIERYFLLPAQVEKILRKEADGSINPAEATKEKAWLLGEISGAKEEIVRALEKTEGVLEEITKDRSRLRAKQHESERTELMFISLTYKKFKLEFFRKLAQEILAVETTEAEDKIDNTGERRAA